MTREEKSGCLFCFWLCVMCVVVWLCVFLLSCVWLFGCIMVCMVRLWCPIRLFGLPSAAKLSRESRGYLLVLADLTHLWGGIFIGTTGTKVSIFHIFHVICIYVHFYDKIFRIFQICDILLVDEWQYILSLVICSIIQHWWLILIVGGWLIVAMLQYVMAAHTDPSPAATSAAPSLPPFLTPIHPYPPSSPIPPHRSKQICLPHSNLSLYGPKLAFTPAFLSSKTSPLKHKSRRERERQTGGHSQQHLPLPST